MDRSKRSEKEEFWRLIIADQQTSGLSARAFCKREGISESMFYGWRSKIAARDSSRPPEFDTTPQLIPVAVSSRAHSPSLAHANGLDNASREIEIHTPGGFRLRVSDSIASSTGRILPKSEIRKAFTYTLNQWDALCRYTQEGFLSYDNNVAERLVKVSAIGRKNYLFVGNEQAGHNAALLYSLVSSAKYIYSVALSSRRSSLRSEPSQ